MGCRHTAMCLEQQQPHPRRMVQPHRVAPLRTCRLDGSCTGTIGHGSRHAHATGGATPRQPALWHPRTPRHHHARLRYREPSPLDHLQATSHPYMVLLLHSHLFSSARLALLVGRHPWQGALVQSHSSCWHSHPHLLPPTLRMVSFALHSGHPLSLELVSRYPRLAALPVLCPVGSTGSTYPR